jgi:hypothetical protein
MVQFNKKKKLFNLYQTQLKNEIGLERKTNKSKKRYIASPTFKTPKVLYDSGWINVTNNLDGNIVGPGIDQDPNAYGELNSFAEATTKKDQIVPIDLFFFFMQELELAEEWLPFVKSTLMVKTHPQVKTIGVFQYVPFLYDTSKFARIKGDGTLIYQGFNPFPEKHSQSEIDNGDLLASLTSKWFKGSIFFTDGGNNWEYRDTNLVNVTTYYDASLSGAPGGNKYNYKVFVVNPIDSISGSSVSGTGTLEVHEWQETSPGQWQENITTTRNLTMSAPILQDITRISVKFGSKFKNGIFQGSIGSPGTSILTDGILQNAANVPSFDKIGTVPRGSVSHTLVHETVSGQPSNGLYRLWYDNKRALEFKINGSYDLQNLPFTGAYQSGTLPYSQLRVEVNPDPYPLEEIDNESYHRGHKTETWARITAINASRQKFRYFANGTIQMTAPASKNNGTTAFFVDETYSNHGGGFYEKDGTNRDPKEIPLYIPDQHVVQFRLKLTVANPKYYRDVRGYKK